MTQSTKRRRAAPAAILTGGLASMLGGIGTAHAEDGKLDLSFYARARIESISGQFRPAPAPDDTALFLRTQIAAEYDAGPVRIGGEVIDARAYFQRRNSSAATAEINAVEPVQAYLKSDFSTAVTVTLGRFTMDQGSRRLIARNLFRNSTNAFTGARIDLKNKGGDRASLFWTLPQTRLPDDPEGLAANRVALDRERIGLQFFGGSATTATLARGITLEAYLYRLSEQDAPGILTRNRRLWTPGLRLLRPAARGKTDFEVEGAWQGGTVRGSTRANDVDDVPVSAWFAHAHLGHSFATIWSPRVAVQVDVASGDRPGRGFNRFDPLFGVRVFEFGPTGLYAAVAGTNVATVEGRVEVTPSKRWDGYLAARPLWLASASDSFSGTGVRDPLGRSERYAGTQIEARARYWLMPKKVRLTLGYTNLFKGEFLTRAPSAPATGDTRYGYGEITLTL